MTPPRSGESAASPPIAATDNAINVAAYAVGAFAIVTLGGQSANPVWAGLLCLALIAATIACGDLFILRVHRRPSAGLSACRPFDRHRVTVKLVGLAATLILLTAAYALLLPLAATRFVVVLGLLPAVLIVIAVVSPAYFAFVDRRMDQPEDGYWQFGQLILGRIGGRDWPTLRTFALGWVIKGFFLPLMTAAFFSVSASLTTRLSGGDVTSVVSAFRLSFDLILFIDLAVAVLGYVLTVRVLDSQIRSCNPLWYGWIATLVCYYPFWGILYPGLLGYSDGNNWDSWFAGMPAMLIAWGGLILVAKVMWVWANVTFGLRFSNLTHRGILTNGPFRYTKHPSYISKNIAWWLISLPFLSEQGWQEALPNCVALLFVNAIYYVRAKVEERHLMSDPVYAEYAAWIEQHGLFARIGRLVSAQYTPETSRRS